MRKIKLHARDVCIVRCNCIPRKIFVFSFQWDYSFAICTWKPRVIFSPYDLRALKTLEHAVGLNVTLFCAHKVWMQTRINNTKQTTRERSRRWTILSFQTSLGAAKAPTLLSSYWRIYCNQTLIGNRVLRTPGTRRFLPVQLTPRLLDIRETRKHTRDVWEEPINRSPHALSHATRGNFTRMLTKSSSKHESVQSHLERLENSARGTDFISDAAQMESIISKLMCFFEIYKIT